MTSLRVIVVDDEPSMRMLLRLTLDCEDGIDVIAEAADGIEAVRAASNLQPDVMVLDVNMPRMNGLDALDRILESSPGTRVVMFSALEPSTMEPEALARGAVGYVQKGADVEVVVTAVRNAATMRRDTASRRAPSTT